MEMFFKIIMIIGKYIKEKPVRSIFSIASSMVLLGLATYAPPLIIFMVLTPVWLVIMVMLNVVIDM